MGEVRPRRPIRAKINDVAELAGVSMKTVSRVLNNEPNVRAETRTKVKAAMKSLNYVPDFSARSLAGQRSYLLAMFYDTASEGYLNKFQAGALAQCREYGYHLLVERAEYDDPDAGAQIAGTAAQTRVDGVILIPPLSDNPRVCEALTEAGVPYVLIAPQHAKGEAPRVDMDDVRAAYDLTQHLIELGHKRIAHIKGHPDHGVSELRYQGYRNALIDAGIDVRPDYVEQGLFAADTGSQATRRLVKLEDPPTAIFAANDEMAIGAIMVAEEAGYRVPDDLSVVGFDDSLIAAIMTPPLTTVRQPIEEMAAGAVDLIIEAVRQRLGEEIVVQARQYPFDIVQRKSAAHIKKES